MSEKKILIVDDSWIIVNTLSAKLKGDGYKALAALDGPTALGLVRKDKPDLILLDIGFPPDVAVGGGALQDGFGILEWLRHMDEGKNIPVVIITASTDSKFEARARAAGAVGYFQKPIDTQALLDLVRRTLGPGTPPPQADAPAR